MLVLVICKNLTVYVGGVSWATIGPLGLKPILSALSALSSPLGARPQAPGHSSMAQQPAALVTTGSGTGQEWQHSGATLPLGSPPKPVDWIHGAPASLSPPVWLRARVARWPPTPGSPALCQRTQRIGKEVAAGVPSCNKTQLGEGLVGTSTHGPGQPAQLLSSHSELGPARRPPRRGCKAK